MYLSLQLPVSLQSSVPVLQLPSLFPDMHITVAKILYELTFARILFQLPLAKRFWPIYSNYMFDNDNSPLMAPVEKLLHSERCQLSKITWIFDLDWQTDLYLSVR